MIASFQRATTMAKRSVGAGDASEMTFGIAAEVFHLVYVTCAVVEIADMNADFGGLSCRSQVRLKR